jgi:hypothetical protein
MSVPTTGQKRLVIVGATGMVGGYALRDALENPAVGRATSIGRRKLGISHPKLTEVLHRDFADCSALAETLSGQDAAVFCLGAYTGAVSDAELRTISVDYAVEFARVLRSSSPDAAFSFLSGSGADPTGRSRMPFARYKGEAEKVLRAGPFRLRLHPPWPGWKGVVRSAPLGWFGSKSIPASTLCAPTRDSKICSAGSGSPDPGIELHRVVRTRTLDRIGAFRPTRREVPSKSASRKRFVEGRSRVHLLERRFSGVCNCMWKQRSRTPTRL